MGDNSEGFKNEHDLVNYLNCKYFYELNENMKKFIKFLFNSVDDNEQIFSCAVNKEKIKPDILIKMGYKTKYISIKRGTGNSIHQEYVNTFCEFLKNINLPQNIIDDLLLYHFGDDTIDGSGAIRYETKVVKEKYKDKIQKINTEFNKKDYLIKLIDRILFCGINASVTADVLYHGDVNQGIWASKEEIIDYLVENHKDIKEMKGVQISKLTYQPWSRDPKGEAKHKFARWQVQIKWATMVKDILAIRGNIDE